MLLNSYIGLVAEGLKLNMTGLHVHWVVVELHVAANVEVHPLGEPHHVVLVHLDRLGGVAKLWGPEARDKEDCWLVRSSAPDFDCLVDEHVRLPHLLDIIWVLEK